MALSFKNIALSGKKKAASAGDGGATSSPPATGAAKLKPGLAEKLAGESTVFRGTLSAYLPSDLVGGSIPHVPGFEDEAVWNAAAQACGTEKVHFCYSIDQGRLWYLACPSAALASNPDSWCPLAAALPGNSEYWDRETVYLYEQEGSASALRWDPETGRMQIFLGATRTLLPRIQSMDANFTTINPEVAQVVPWRNRNLRTELLSRAAARMLLMTGLLLNAVIIAILMFSYAAVNFISRDLASVQAASAQASEELMLKAYSALQSDAIKHMVRIQEILDSLQTIDGTLVRYEVDKGKTEWEALVPQVYQGGIANIKGTVQPQIEKDGRVRLKGTN